MIKLRLFLVLMAAGMVALLIQLARLHAGQTPESLLERAREELTAEEPDYDGAFLRIDRGLAQCRTPETEELKKELARTRILLHRSRWEHGRENPDALQDESDLDQVLILGTKYLERFDLEDKEILRIAKVLERPRKVKCIGSKSPATAPKWSIGCRSSVAPTRCIWCRSIGFPKNTSGFTVKVV